MAKEIFKVRRIVLAVSSFGQSKTPYKNLYSSVPFLPFPLLPLKKLSAFNKVL